MNQLWLDLASLLVYGPLIVLCHELGHAAFARMGGYRVTDFAIGLGRPLFRLELRKGVVLHLDRWFFLGGACTAIPIEPPSARRAWFHLGGLLVQAGLMVPLWFAADHRFFFHAGLFNAMVMAHNAIPWRFAGAASDGWFLVDALRGVRRGANVIEQRRVLERSLERAVRVGTPLGIIYTRTCLAWADVLLGKPEAARDLFREDPPAAALDPWVDALYHYVCAEWHRAEGRPLASLRTARDAVRTLDLSHRPEGQALIALAEARALVHLDSPAQAQRALARVAGTGGPIGRQAAVTQLWTCMDDPAETLEHATRTVLHAAHRPGLDPADAAVALWEAGRQLEMRGQSESARAARRGGLEVAHRLLHRLPEPQARAIAHRMGEVAGAAAPGLAATGRR